MYILFFEGAIAQESGNCDFEDPKGLCGYTQDNRDDFNWTRHRGSTTSFLTGPSSDHTTTTGLNVAGKPYIAVPVGNICIFVICVLEAYVYLYNPCCSTLP